MRSLLVLSILLTLPALLPAAEVTNLKVGQRGDNGFATYDLRGDIGEREAEVTVSLTIADRKYDADKLTLKGDFGKKVKTGRGKQIVWDILADISSGYDGEVIWHVDAVGSTVPVAVKEIPKPAPPPAAVAVTTTAGNELPFEFRALVARDRNTGLFWLREVSTDGNGINFDKARGAAAKLLAEKFAGCSNWNLPLADDLAKIVKYAVAAGYTGKKSKGYPADYFNAIGFKGVANDYYWSAFTDSRTGPQHHVRLAVDLEDGIATEKAVKDYLQFWPVCTPD